MAICNVIDDPDRTEEQHERVTAHVRGSGPVPPQGCRLVLLGRQRAITVWDSAEQRDRFLAERLRPAYEAAGLSLDEVTARSSTSRCSSAATSPAWRRRSSERRTEGRRCSQTLSKHPAATRARALRCVRHRRTGNGMLDAWRSKLGLRSARERAAR
ncbi:MAG: hypothetical protein ACJ77L_05395 [Solirubrobacteraceae bacterium]